MEIFSLDGKNPFIEFITSKFPDGQQSVTITDFSPETNKALIRIRLTNFRDLELLICATAALKGLGIKDISVFIPYFLGARSDRKFEKGGSNYIKDVIAPIINLQGYSNVQVLDPHSDVIEACINNFNKTDNLQFTKMCIRDILGDNLTKNDITIISPDAGALKKIYDIAAFNYNIEDVVVATKHRDIKTGKILSTNVPLEDKHSKKTFVIFDDICDGGRTFVEIAKVVKEKYPENNIFLFVTHGIFSNSFLELSKYFTRVYSTNSYSDIDCDEHSDYTVDGRFLKQFPVIYNTK